MILAQLTRAPGPLAAADSVRETWRRDRPRSDNEGAVSIAMRQPGSSRSASTKSSSRSMPTAAARARCGHAGSTTARHPRMPAAIETRHGMPQIVLAVAKGALAVFPGFAPVNRCQRDQDQVGPAGARRSPNGVVEQAALLEDVTVRGVVVHARAIAQSQPRATDNVRFRRMKISARRVHAKRPARPLELFPRGKAERMTQHVADRCDGQRFGSEPEPAGVFERDRPRRVSVRAGGAGRWVQRHSGTAFVRAERFRLRRPVQIAERPRERVEVMLRSVMVATHDLDRAVALPGIVFGRAHVVTTTPSS